VSNQKHAEDLPGQKKKISFVRKVGKGRCPLLISLDLLTVKEKERGDPRGDTATVAAQSQKGFCAKIIPEKRKEGDQQDFGNGRKATRFIM